MDSLLANYASSDDEDNVEEEDKKASAPPPKPSLFSSSLPSPKAPSSSSSSSLFSSLPPPKSSISPAPRNPSAPKSRGLGGEDGENDEIGSKSATKNAPSAAPSSKAPSSSIFSSLPQPKTSASSSFFSSLPPPKSSQQSNLPKPSNPASLDQNPKKVVQVTLPSNPSVLGNGNLDEDDDEEEEKERKRRKDSSSIASSKSLSSMLPAPKNSFWSGPAAARRSIAEADVPAATPEGIGQQQKMSGLESYGGCYDGGWVGASGEAGAGEPTINSGFTNTSEASGWDPNYGSAVEYGSRGGVEYGSEGGMDYGSYGGTMDYGSYGSDGSVAMATPEIAGMGKIAGKRGRKEIPMEVVEVKQDELMKNRPREDKAKLTGLAFGPSYQPVSSVKGKPTKLHKRKHQIGSLYFDMKQKEMELAERRSKGLLTKAETQAKYGW
ncbi:flocculation protein FLO11 [Phoenix dactylifera]|uniref:Flocculation protein FLO11 n=1 Tax=Phoenix dactylifera TaxID=42345 RepID=A0A8B9AE78_PHODC|nr:flocculation protein FLO11 [Phoenix dactylifera]